MWNRNCWRGLIVHVGKIQFWSALLKRRNEIPLLHLTPQSKSQISAFADWSFCLYSLCFSTESLHRRLLIDRDLVLRINITIPAAKLADWEIQSEAPPLVAVVSTTFGFGRSHYSIKEWFGFLGSFLIKSCFNRCCRTGFTALERNAIGLGASRRG